MHWTGLDRDSSETLLAEHHGQLRAAIDSYRDRDSQTSDNSKASH
jgi:N-acetylmuramic acid 6-phosphate (MurNAc-6-P) etherase